MLLASEDCATRKAIWSSLFADSDTATYQVAVGGGMHGFGPPHDDHHGNIPEEADDEDDYMHDGGDDAIFQRELLGHKSRCSLCAVHFATVVAHFPAAIGR